MAAGAGTAVGAAVGAGVGAGVGTAVAAGVGAGVGTAVATGVGTGVGAMVAVGLDAGVAAGGSPSVHAATIASVNKASTNGRVYFMMQLAVFPLSGWCVKFGAPEGSRTTGLSSWPRRPLIPSHHVGWQSTPGGQWTVLEPVTDAPSNCNLGNRVVKAEVARWKVQEGTPSTGVATKGRL